MKEGQEVQVEATIVRMLDFGRLYLVKLPGGAQVVVDAFGVKEAR